MPHEAAVGAVFGVNAQGRGPARVHRGHDRRSTRLSVASITSKTLIFGR